MNRTPLRPLARILQARQNGENPDAIERENLRMRHEQQRDKARTRAEGRLLVMGGCFLFAFMAIGVRMGTLAASEPQEPRTHTTGVSIAAARADIVDRKGRILATNMETHSLYAHPQQMIEPERAAQELASIFSDLDYDRMIKDFTNPKRKFVWVRKKLSPEQMQQVHEIGEPGLLFGPREMRLYPNGALAAHILGGTGFGKEGVNAAELEGRAGIEKQLDDVLRDPAREGAPLVLSLDLTVQDAMEDVLDGGMKIFNAKGAAAILMDVHNGEVIAMASLPDFDPNQRPRPLIEGDASDSPLFNRAVQGVYELGSTFKIFAAAQAMDLGLVNAYTEIDTNQPIKLGGHSIREFQNKRYGTLTIEDIIAKSSNRGTGRLALMIGNARQKTFMDGLGMLEPTPIEIVEAQGSKPLFPKNWGDLSSVTISYGHGISVSPMHLAAGYAMIANGGRLVQPTLLKTGGVRMGDRVIGEDVALASRKMLRKVITDGTASLGEVPGYHVAGKTGTADKPNEQGGYHEDKVINTFATMFPLENPEYVLIVTLDEPVENTGKTPRRTAGWTAVPVASELIGRIAPLLGLRPDFESVQDGQEVLVSQ